MAIAFGQANIIIYCTCGACRPEMEVDQVASRVATAIIKDCVVEDGKPDVQVTAGDGLVDFPVVLKKLVEGGVPGPLVRGVRRRPRAGADRPRSGVHAGIREGHSAGDRRAMTKGRFGRLS